MSRHGEEFFQRLIDLADALALRAFKGSVSSWSHLKQAAIFPQKWSEVPDYLASLVQTVVRQRLSRSIGAAVAMVILAQVGWSAFSKHRLDLPQEPGPPLAYIVQFPAKQATGVTKGSFISTADPKQLAVSSQESFMLLLIAIEGGTLVCNSYHIRTRALARRNSLPSRPSRLPVIRHHIEDIAKDKAVLPQDATRQALATVEGNWETAWFLVIGRTDQHGSRELNEALSEKRALAAVAELANRHVPREHIIIVPRASMDASTNYFDPAGDAKSRNVEILQIPNPFDPAYLQVLP